MAETDTKDKNVTEEPQETQDKKTADPGINTDGREAFHWESGYPSAARKEIRREAIYIGVVLAFALVGVFLNWRGMISFWLGIEETRVAAFEGSVLYFFAGLTGGTIYGMKYFYRVVARGYWSQDRRYWRIFSPWISAVIAVVIGCMVISGYINASQTPSTAAGLCLGFLAGYFADDAVGKMSDVAKALFGNSSKNK